MTVFNADVISPDADPRETLIGEGKKYANEDEALKALLNSQIYIPQLERERAEQRSAFDDVFNELKLIKEAKPMFESTPPIAPKEPVPPVVAPATPTDDLQNLIRQSLAKEREADTVKRNTDEVVSGLVSLYGDEAKANDVIRQKAVELGVSVEFLQDVAAKSPKAFFTTIGANVTAQPSAAPSKGDVRPQALATGTPQEGTWEYFQAIKDNNPKAYWSPSVQRSLMKAAQAAASEGKQFSPT